MEKYFIQNDYTGYLVQIFEVGFAGVSTEIFGKVSFDKGNVENILDTIRGTGLNLQLEANPLLTFEEFSEADEKTYTVTVKKGNQIIFNGFLKPDGVTQSFVRDIWVVDLDFIDGLGTLKDLAFVKPNGLNYTGKMSMFEVIQGCLARTGLVMTINTFIDVYYLEYAGTNILKDTYLSADRFFKIDAQTTGGGTTMTCEEVLNSILNLFSACITQQDGYWWVYRPNDFLNKVKFIDNSLDTTFTKNLYKKVGSQIDNYYPHHCNANQQIQTKGAISAYRLNYKYGFKQTIIKNPTLKHDTALVFEDWAKGSDLNAVAFINDINDLAGLKAQPFDFIDYLINVLGYPVDYPFSFMPILSSDFVPILAGSPLELKVDLSLMSETNASFVFQIVRSDGYYIQQDGSWTTSVSAVEVVVGGLASVGNEITNNQQWTLLTNQVPVNCSVKVIINPVYSGAPGFNVFPVAEIQSIQLNNNYNYDGRVGEFHTVARLVSPSSIIKENQEVYNGDSIGDVFEGAIYKSDKTTLTTLWTRKGKLEEKYLLRISAEDDMRIRQKTIKTFEGDFYGYLPYLSIIEINNVNGLFMFIEHSYDTDSNITKGKLQQFYTSEVSDLQYALTYDYGNTVKPSIRS